jgi:hypothetical protein
VNRPAPGAAGSGASERSAVGAGRSLLRGVAAFLGVAMVAQLIGLAEFAASGGAYRWWTWIKVGVLYLVSFFGVSVRVDVGGRGLFQMHLSLMAGTVVAGWLLFRAGRASAAGVARSRARLRAACVIAGCVVPVWAVGLPAGLRFPDLGGPGVDATVRAVGWQVVAFPLAFAVLTVAAGAWSVRAMRSSVGADLRRIVAGGWRMCRLALVLAFAGLLVLAAVRSDRTARYAGWLGSQGRGGALLFGHQVLAAPNQSFFVLAPSMGGITDIGETGVARATTALSMSRIGAVAFGIPGLNRTYPARPLGGFFYLFLLVPALATVLGGTYAARGEARLGRRLLFGAGAGVVFGGLVAVGSVFAAVESPISLAQGPLSLRTAMPSTALLALAWGITGGAIGSLFAPQAPEGAGPEVGAEPPARPTSA